MPVHMSLSRRTVHLGIFMLEIIFTLIRKVAANAVYADDNGDDGHRSYKPKCRED